MTFVLPHTAPAPREPMYALMLVILGSSYCALLLPPLLRLSWPVSVPTVLLCVVAIDKLAHSLARAVRRGITGDQA